MFLQLAIRSAIFATKLQTLLPHVINALFPHAVAYCITYFASRWTSTIISSSFGPYPERSERGTMTAVLLSTSVATLSANIYSGAYTVSTSPAQQSRLCVSFITLEFISNLKLFSRQLFSRSLSGSRRVKCYVLSQFGISQYCRFAPSHRHFSHCK
jgi:hypothetical protein